MKEHHTFYLTEVSSRGKLSADDTRHAVRTLRMKEGDEIQLLDGKGNVYTATIEEATQKSCTYRVLSSHRQAKPWKGHVHLAIAPTKHIDRTEWLVEKATEIGVDEITFLKCRYSERTSIRIDRMEKIVVAAMKQSRNAYFPQLHDMTLFARFVENEAIRSREADDAQAVFIAHCWDDQPRYDACEWLRDNPKAERLTLMIGPEGDFSIEETRLAIQQGIVPVTLGKSRLRTETAGLVGLMMMNLHNRKPHSQSSEPCSTIGCDAKLQESESILPGL